MATMALVSILGFSEQRTRVTRIGLDVGTTLCIIPNTKGTMNNISDDDTFSC
jgi:hypothetical protein